MRKYRVTIELRTATIKRDFRTKRSARKYFTHMDAVCYALDEVHGLKYSVKIEKVEK